MDPSTPWKWYELHEWPILKQKWEHKAWAIGIVFMMNVFFYFFFARFQPKFELGIPERETVPYGSALARKRGFANSKLGGLSRSGFGVAEKRKNNEFENLRKQSNFNVQPMVSGSDLD